MLGPRLNAAGRIGHADDALSLLMEPHKGEAHNRAHALDAMNRQRQTIEMRVVEDAKAQAEASMGKERKPAVIVAASEGWHPGVVGLGGSAFEGGLSCAEFCPCHQ